MLISEESILTPTLLSGEGQPRNDVLTLQLPRGKKGQKQFLDAVLPQSMHFIASHLSKGAAVCICCDSGKDTSVGVALTALQMFFDGDGEFQSPRGYTGPSEFGAASSIGT